MVSSVSNCFFGYLFCQESACLVWIAPCFPAPTRSGCQASCPQPVYSGPIPFASLAVETFAALLEAVVWLHCRNCFAKAAPTTEGCWSISAMEPAAVAAAQKAEAFERVRQRPSAEPEAVPPAEHQAYSERLWQSFPACYQTYRHTIPPLAGSGCCGGIGDAGPLPCIGCGGACCNCCSTCISISGGI